MEAKKYATGTKIFAEGDPGDCAYLVQSGKVAITRATGGEPMVLGHIGPGGMFGEMALINAKPRMASATAAEDTILVVVPPKVFEAELPKMNAVTKALLLSMMGHVRSLTERLEKAEAPETVAEEEEKPMVEFYMPGSDGAYRRVK